MAAISFAGISTGIPTDQLIQAILKQEGAPLDRLQARQTTNNQKKNILQSIRSSLTSLATSISSLNSSSLSARTVTSSDAASVSATAKGAVSGSYDIKVSQLATRARLDINKEFKPSEIDVGEAGDVYTLVDKDGNKTEIELEAGKTSLADLNKAINDKTSESGIKSEIVEKGPGEYQLVLSSETGGSVGISGKAGNPLGVSSDVDNPSSSVAPVDITKLNLSSVGVGKVPIGNAGEVYTIVGKDGKPTEIKLQDGYTSLADLNGAINAMSADTGVSSTLIKISSGNYQLVLSSTETGIGTNGGDKIGIFGTVGNALGVAENEAGAFNGAVAAVNAMFTLNGVDIQRASNTVTDAIDGITFVLNKAEDKTITLNVALDKDSVIKAYQDVVSKFNAAYKAYSDATGKGGALSGDLSLQTMFSQLRSSLRGVIGDSDYNKDGQTVTNVDKFYLGTSATLGLKTERDGTLSLDTKMLEEALDKDPAMVGKVLDKASSDTKKFVDGLTSTVGGTISSFINGIDTMNSNLSKQIDNLQARLDRRKEVLTAQFARLESLVGQLQAAGQSLSGLA